MALDCASITKNVVLDACKRATAGINGSVILINYDDINRLLTVETANVVSGLQLKEGKFAYKYDCKDASPVGEYNLAVGKWIPAWDHILTIKALAKTQDMKDAIEILSKAKLVAIVDNKEVGGTEMKTRYEMYGYEAGLKLLESANTTDFADETVYNLKLGSGDAKENTLPKTIFKTDAAATELIIKGLFPIIP